MAEIRKHTERAEGLAAAVRQAIGEDIRPIPPGSSREDEKATAEEDHQSAASGVPGFSASFLTTGSGAFLQSYSMPEEAEPDADQSD